MASSIIKWLPRREWLAYHNEELISNIDSQAFRLDIEYCQKKEKLVIEKRLRISECNKNGSLTYEELTAICLYRIKTWIK
ncbi:MAG: hypothetical protein ACLVJO_04820 [[Clostridium] scindens]